jgi:hypothetical protein
MDWNVGGENSIVKERSFNAEKCPQSFLDLTSLPSFRSHCVVVHPACSNLTIHGNARVRVITLETELGILDLKTRRKAKMKRSTSNLARGRSSDRVQIAEKW